jgi:hypothetical protein
VEQKNDSVVRKKVERHPMPLILEPHAPSCGGQKKRPTNKRGHPHTWRTTERAPSNDNVLARYNPDSIPIGAARSLVQENALDPPWRTTGRGVRQSVRLQRKGVAVQIKPYFGIRTVLFTFGKGKGLGDLCERWSSFGSICLP